MAKDPAFLFYPESFIMGTLHFSNEEIGIYIKLLCFQHQHGGIIDTKTFSAFIGTHEIVTSKFVKTEDGFYNKRLMEEMHKRNIKSSNLSDNAKARWGKEKEKQSNCNAIARDLHMPTRNRNRDKDKDITKEHKSLYGAYKHVRLTDEEHKKLTERFGNNTQRLITELDEGIELKGYKYKNHYLAILKWSKNSKEIKPTTTREPSVDKTQEYIKKLKEGRL